MALFEDEEIDFENEFGDSSNTYLSDPNKGLELVKSILSSGNGSIATEEFEKLIETQLLPMLARIEFKDELEIYYELNHLSEKLKEQKKVNMLKGKTVLGIGGKFSAGKSCFINSITNAELPEAQRPTTSIATYIINAQKKKNIALTYKNQSIELDDDAIAALTHEFFDKYHIGFSKLIQNLVIQTPNFTYPNIAVLDTPGYNKSDVAKKEDVTDAEKAREQLKSVDFLIWLVDSENGVIRQNDLDFIDTLNNRKPILVVFNKAGLISLENMQKIVSQSKQLLKGTNKKIFDVIAYDSLNGETIIGKGSLERFLELVNSDKDKLLSLDDQITNITKNLNNQIQNQINELNKRRNQLEKIIYDNKDVMKSRSILNSYSLGIRDVEELRNRHKEFDMVVKRIKVVLAKLDKESCYE